MEDFVTSSNRKNALEYEGVDEFEEQVTVNLVELYVVVTDRSGTPVRDLAKEQGWKQGRAHADSLVERELRGGAEGDKPWRSCSIEGWRRSIPRLETRPIFAGPSLGEHSW